MVTDCLTINGVCLLIVVIKYICKGTRINGTIIKISSSIPGVNMIPHCKSSYSISSSAGQNPYLDTKGVEGRQDRGEQGRNHESDDMEKHNQSLELVDGVLDYLLDQDSEPKGIELRTIVAKCCQEAHELAHFCL